MLFLCKRFSYWTTTTLFGDDDREENRKKSMLDLYGWEWDRWEIILRSDNDIQHSGINLSVLFYQSIVCHCQFVNFSWAIIRYCNFSVHLDF